MINSYFGNQVTKIQKYNDELKKYLFRYIYKNVYNVKNACSILVFCLLYKTLEWTTLTVSSVLLLVGEILFWVSARVK